MSKHTPGPWKIGKYLNSENSNHGIVIAENPHGEGAEDIASIAWVGGGFHREQEANARLIAAAPELLEALDNCITNENATCIVQNDVAYMIRRFKAINQICRAAIAKATGE